MKPVQQIRNREYRDKVSLEEIIDYIPKNDYFVVFGTSHSEGFCSDMPNEELEYQDIWCNKLSKKLNVEVLNLSKAGITNRNILQNMAEYKNLQRKIKSKCIGVIAEVRMGEHVIPLQNQTYVNKEDEFFSQNNLENTYLTGTYPFHGRPLLEDLTQRMDHFTIYNYNTRGMPENYRQTIGDMLNFSDELEFQKFFIKMVDNFFKSPLNITSSYNDVFLMKEMFADTVPFYWFSWNLAARQNIRAVELVENMYKNLGLFDTMIIELGVQEYLELNYSKDWIKQNRCKCDHDKEPVHEVVCNLVHEKIKAFGG